MSSTGTIGFGSNYQLTEGSGIYWNSGSNYGVYCSLEFVEGNVDGEVPPVPEPEAPGLTYEYIQVGDTIPVNPETNGTSDTFSYSIDSNFDGSYIIIGSPYEDYSATGLTQAGIVRVYQYNSTQNNWNTISTTFGSDTNSNYGFALSISNDGNTFAVYDRIAGVSVLHYSASFGSYNKLGNTLKISGYDSSNTILSTSNNGADICKNNPSLSLSSDSSTVAFSMYSSSAQQLVVLIYRFINGIWNRLGSQDFNGTECKLSYNGSQLIISTDQTFYQILSYNAVDNTWNTIKLVENNVVATQPQLANSGNIYAYIGSEDDLNIYVEQLTDLNTGESNQLGDTLKFPENTVLTYSLSDDGLKMLVGDSNSNTVTLYYYNYGQSMSNSITESTSNSSYSYVIDQNSYNISYNTSTTYSVFSYETTTGSIPYIDGYNLNIKAYAKGGDSYGGNTNTSTESLEYSGGGGGGASFTGIYQGTESVDVQVDTYGNITISTNDNESLTLQAGGIGYYQLSDLPDGYNTNIADSNQSGAGLGGTATPSSGFLSLFTSTNIADGTDGANSTSSNSILTQSVEPQGGNPGITNTYNYGTGADGNYVQGVGEGNPIYVS